VTTLPAARDALLAALAALPAVTRVRVARMLADGSTAREVGALADAAVYELTRAEHATYASVAATLGVSINAINKAVRQHNARTASADSSPAARSTRDGD